MNNKILFSLAASIALTGCGSDSSNSDSSRTPKTFNASEYTPITGSDSIIGTWVGVSNYTETSTYTENGSKVVDTETGVRRAILQVVSDGTGGYSTYDCKGRIVDVEFDNETNVMSIIGRDVSVENYNTGTSTISTKDENLQTTESETATWIKVSNEDNSRLGTINLVRDSSAPASDADRNVTRDIYSFCQEYFEGKDNEGLFWGYKTEQIGYQWYDQAQYFEGSRFAYDNVDDHLQSSEMSVTVYEDAEEGHAASIAIQADTASSFKATYSGNSTHYYDGENRDVSLSATVSLVIPD